MQGGQIFGFDQEVDAACGAGFSADEALTFEGEDHLVDRRRADTEMVLQIGLGGRSAEDAGIGVDEGKILALLFGEGW